MATASADGGSSSCRLVLARSERASTAGSMSPVLSAMATAWPKQRLRLTRIAGGQPDPTEIVKGDRLTVPDADPAGDGQGLGVQMARW